MTSQNYGSTAGVGDAVFSREYQIYWGDERKRLKSSGTVAADVVDPNSGNRFIVRPGNLLGKRTADNKLVMYNPSGTDGSENFVGILEEDLFMANQQTFEPEEKTNVNVAVSAPVRAGQLFIGGVPFVGHPDESAARAAMDSRFVLDDILDQ